MLKLLAPLLFLSLPWSLHAQFLDDPSDSIPALLEQTVIEGKSPGTNSPITKVTVEISLFSKNGSDAPEESRCSGTLIARDLLLTAAHCIVDLKNTERKITKITAKISGHQKIAATAWLADPHYKSVIDEIGIERALVDVGVNDLALVRLEKSVPRDALIAEIPNAEISQSRSLSLTLAGFGRTNFDDPDSGGILHIAQIKGTMITVRHDIDHHIAIQDGKQQPCRGDSGGPLFQINGNHLILVGVTSTVRGECAWNARAISVWHHLPWIRQTAKDLRSSFNI